MEYKRTAQIWFVLLILLLAGCRCAPAAQNPSPSQETVSAEPAFNSPAPEGDDLEALLKNMPLAEKVAQMFFVRCPEEGAWELAETRQPGGYILFARDFKEKTREQVTENIASYQAAARIPMLIGVDEEGGTVTRISRYQEFRDQPFSAARDVYQQGGWSLIEEDTLEKCILLKSLGINVNLGPVCDIAQSKGDFIYDRCFSTEPALVSEFVTRTLTISQSQRVGTVLKHFPGYGDNEDTHTGAAYDKRALSVFETVDFLPFQAGIEAGASCIMVAHNTVECMDAHAPASLSPAVHRIIREELAFTGVILSDDLAMDAVTEYAGTVEQAAVEAVLAGNDMLCCTDFEKQIWAVVEAVEDGRISPKQIDGSVLRILNWKRQLGLL